MLWPYCAESLRIANQKFSTSQSFKTGDINIFLNTQSLSSSFANYYLFHCCLYLYKCIKCDLHQKQKIVLTAGGHKAKGVIRSCEHNSVLNHYPSLRDHILKTPISLAPRHFWTSYVKVRGPGNPSRTAQSTHHTYALCIFTVSVQVVQFVQLIVSPSETNY